MTQRSTTYVFILKVRHGESLPTSSYSRYDTEKHYVFILNVRYGALPTSSYSRYDTEKHYVFILKVRHGEALRIHTQGQGRYPMEPTPSNASKISTPSLSCCNSSIFLMLALLALIVLTMSSSVLIVFKYLLAHFR